MKELFSVDEDKFNLKTVLLFIALAYMFSLAVRYIWIYDFASNIKQFYWQGQIMINNNDGYYWAEGARDILSGSHQQNDLSPITNPASILTAMIAKFLPFLSLDTIILYLPAFLGSLVVVPVILIARALNHTFIGFLAAMLSGIVWSYYHRTMIGYYDTDMLVVVLPSLALWGVVLSLTTNNLKTFFIAPLFLTLSSYWHGGLVNVANGVFIMSLVYVFVFSGEYIKLEKGKLKFTKPNQTDSVFFLILMLIPLFKIAVIYKIATLFIAYFLVLKFREELEKYIKITAIVSFIIYLAFGGISWVMGVLSNAYVSRDVTTGVDLHYYSVVNTVREAGHIDIETLILRISGSWIGIVTAIIGYLLLIVKHRVMIVTLPMVALGFFAIQGGLRFTIFATPFMALGSAYLFFLIASQIKFLFNNKIGEIVKYGVGAILMGVIIYPNVKHVYDYKMPTVFADNTIKVLDDLKKISNREDYVLSWWDYGYPIRYYSDVKTLIDGGKHSGSVNFPVSYALSTTDQKASVNMAKLDVYFTEYAYNNNKSHDYLTLMMDKYKYKDPNKFLANINSVEVPKIKEDIYYFLPSKMLGIFPTVKTFSDLNLKTGEQNKPKFFHIASRYKAYPNGDIDLGRGIKLIQNRYLKIGEQNVPLNKITITMYDNNLKLHKREATINPRSNLNLIFLRDYRMFIVLDNEYYNSTYIKLFVLEDYDKTLFEPVILTPDAKIYKVK